MKKINLILRKCKTLSRQLARTYSYSSLRMYKSAREGDPELWLATTTADADHPHPLYHDKYYSHKHDDDDDHEHRETIFVGSSRRRYVISSKHLNHPLLNALIEKSKQQQKKPPAAAAAAAAAAGDHHHHQDAIITVKCEVVLFDHLLWMLENADPNDHLASADSLEELADLYVF